MLRKILLTSVALPLFGFASVAVAQVEITDVRTTPVTTGTIDNGSPGDIIIRSGGSILVGAGSTAVTIDTNNTVTNEGTIGSADANNTTGILITGGTTGGFTNTGTIELNEDYTAVDTDSDGDLDGPQAIGTGRTGILIAGPSAFVGNVINDTAGRITVEGNDSAGISVLAGLDGNLTNNGRISITGTNSYGIQIASTVNGDVSNAGTINAQGENTVGLGVESAVNGTVTNTGLITANGFRESNRRSAAADRAKLDADDLTIGGAAVSISANVSGGFINGATLNDSGVLTSFGKITSLGSAPAVLVTAGQNGQAGGDVILGAVGTQTDVNDFGLVNDGEISVAGLNDGFAATAILVQGQEVGGVMRHAIIQNGILSSRLISASSFDANARAIWVQNGGVVDTIRNTGTISSTVISQAGQQATTIVVDAGGEVNTIYNSGSLEASFTGSGTGSQAVVITDASGTTDLILNEGQIKAVYLEILPSGETANPNDTTRHTVAIDTSANTTGMTIRQQANPDSSGTIPSITGDILLGSGGDLVELNAGTVNGDIVFGDGADVLTIDGGAAMTGALYDSDGLLTLDVRDGLLALGSSTSLNLTDATFGTNALLQMTLSDTANGIIGATFNASGNVTFLDGAAIAPILSTLIGDGGSFNFLQANSLSIAGSLNALLNSDQLPFLYNVNLRQGPSGNTLVLDLQRRSAADLGFDVNQAAAYNPWFTALSQSSDAALESGFAQLTTADEFYAAYNQLLPEFGAAALQFTLANTDGTTGAVASRLDNVRRGYGKQGGLWAEEIGYYMNRNLSSISQPYRGFGLGLAIGVDRPLGPFEAVGIAVSGFSNEIKQAVGFDKPLTSQSGQIGAYAGGKFGGFNFETHSAIGYDDFSSERVLQFGDVSRTALGGWSGYHIASTTRLSYDITSGKWFIRPSASLDYLWLRENSYIEAGGGTGFDLDVNARTSKSLAGTAAITFGRKFGNLNGSWWSPRLRVGARNEFQGNAANTVARFSGFTDEFTLTPQQLPKTALLLGFSISAGSRFTSFGFDYDADVRNGFVRHTGRLVIRFIF